MQSRHDKFLYRGPHCLDSVEVRADASAYCMRMRRGLKEESLCFDDYHIRDDRRSLNTGTTKLRNIGPTEFPRAFLHPVLTLPC